MARRSSSAAGGGPLAPRYEFESIGSTQSHAIELARSGEPAGTSVVALAQSDGVGRDGRSWSSPPGGLYLSLILKPPRTHGSLVPVSAALAVVRLARDLGATTLVKWPNDVVADPGDGDLRKLAGVLVDQVASRDGASTTVIGVGVNASTDPATLPVEIRDGSTSLSELCDRRIEPSEIVDRLVEGLRRIPADLDAPDGPRSLIGEARRSLAGRGRRISVDGGTVGTLRELADDGALEIEGSDGPVLVHAGHVTWEVP